MGPGQGRDLPDHLRVWQAARVTACGRWPAVLRTLPGSAAHTELYDRSIERALVDSLAGTPPTGYVQAAVGPVSPIAQEEQWAHLVKSVTAPSSP